MLTSQEIEMLAGLIKRAGVNIYEMVWANSILDRLRVAALEQQAEAALKPEPEPEPEEKL